MNTHEAKMFHWNTSDLDLTLNHLRRSTNLELSVMIVFDAVLQVEMITVDKQ